MNLETLLADSIYDHTLPRSSKSPSTFFWISIKMQNIKLTDSVCHKM